MASFHCVDSIIAHCLLLTLLLALHCHPCSTVALPLDAPSSTPVYQFPERLLYVGQSSIVPVVKANKLSAALQHQATATAEAAAAAAATGAAATAATGAVAAEVEVEAAGVANQRASSGSKAALASDAKRLSVMRHRLRRIRLSRLEASQGASKVAEETEEGHVAEGNEAEGNWAEGDGAEGNRAEGDGAGGKREAGVSAGVAFAQKRGAAVKASPVKAPLVTVISLKANVSDAAKNLVSGFDGLDAWAGRYSGTGLFSTQNAFLSPPDASGCIGSGFIVQPVNLAIAVYSTSGGLLAGPANTHQFLGLNPILTHFGNEGDKVTDGSCVYDKDSKRFYFAIAWHSQGASSPYDKLGQGILGSGLAVAVSSAKNPLLPWTVHFIPTTNSGTGSNDDRNAPLNYTGAPFFGDYPQLGIDKYGLYVTSDQLGNFSDPDQNVFLNGRNIYCISKALLLKKSTVMGVRFAMPFRAARDLGAIVVLRGTSQSSYKYDTARGGTVYMASVAPYSSIALWTLTNTSALNSPSPSGISLHLSYVPMPASWSPAPEGVSQKKGPIPLGATLGFTSPVKVDTGADQHVVEGLSGIALGNQAWVTWTVGFGKAAPSAVALARINVSFTADSQIKGGLRMQASLGLHRILTVPGQALIYPALTFAGNGRGVLAFALMGSNYFPSTAFTFINQSGAVDKSFYLAASGKAPIEDWTGYEPNTGVTPFGDWQTATVDETGGVWVFSEYVSGKHTTPTTDETWANWATRISRITL